MKLLKRITFAFKYNFNSEFVVWSEPDQTAMRFLQYEDAKDFCNKHLEYRPKVMVAVERANLTNQRKEKTQ